MSKFTLATSLLTALALSAMAGHGVAAEHQAMEKHMKEGIEGVAPETTHATDHKTAAEQAKAERDQAMQHHIQEGTQGVSPETTHATDRETAAEQAQTEKDRAMQHHMQEATQGVSPEAPRSRRP